MKHSKTEQNEAVCYEHGRLAYFIHRNDLPDRKPSKKMNRAICPYCYSPVRLWWRTKKNGKWT